MTFSERINEDLKAAMKSGDQLRRETLRLLRAQLIELTKRGPGKPLTAEDELSAVLAAIKKRKEAIELYQQAGRKELVEKESKELDIIQSYLPRQLSRDEADAEVARIIRLVGALTAKDFGKVMGVAMKELKGRADGKVVEELVMQKLGS